MKQTSLTAKTDEAPVVEQEKKLSSEEETAKAEEKKVEKKKVKKFDLNELSCTLHMSEDGTCTMDERGTFVKNDIVELTPEQLEACACIGKTPLPATIVFEWDHNPDFEFTANNKKYFTVQEILTAIAEYETITRGGEAYNHVFFEGLYPTGGRANPNRFGVQWGS